MYSLHTYMIGRYNPSVRIIDLVSHTTSVVCVNFLYISGGTYSLKSIPNDRFEKLFMAILFTLRVFARNLLRGNRRRNTFCILFWCLAWDSNPGFSSNKPTHYLLDHGDFQPFISLFESFKTTKEEIYMHSLSFLKCLHNEANRPHGGAEYNFNYSCILCGRYLKSFLKLFHQLQSRISSITASATVWNFKHFFFFV